ncbi:MAG TPA: hypothetical protein PLU36_03315 [Chitinophagaceae bacterium]|nr:hypothetical protein [Chitinophagaceae bacterium]
MKKLIVIFTVVLSAAVIAFVGCQKTSTEKQEQGIVGTTEVSANSLGMSVNSSYGFLVFTTTDDVDAYLDYLKANTHADVQENLSSIGFSNSLGATLYDEEYATELVTEEQAINYIVNTHRIFQVQDVIMKPINEVNEEVKWEFLLTMVSSNLNNSSYENLIANYYDENTMNKFATNWQDSTFDLLEFIDATPNGYEETEPNSTEALIPLYGRKYEYETSCSQPHYNVLGNCVRDCQTIRRRVTHIWFITIKGPKYVESSWSETSEGC